MSSTGSGSSLWLVNASETRNAQQYMGSTEDVTRDLVKCGWNVALSYHLWATHQSPSGDSLYLLVFLSILSFMLERCSPENSQDPFHKCLGRGPLYQLW